MQRSMPSCAIIDKAMHQGVGISFIVIGDENKWWRDVKAKRRVNLQEECYEMNYPRAWHNLTRKAIIADEHFFF